MQWLWNTAEMKQTVKEKLFFFLTGAFLLSVQCHGTLMHANKLLHGSRSVLTVNQCGMNSRKYANGAKYGPSRNYDNLKPRPAEQKVWQLFLEWKKKKLPTARGGRAAATRAACKQVQLTTKQHLWPSAEQMWKMELLFSPNWIRRTNIRVLSSIKNKPHLTALR